jgi:hypothetical protein
MGASGHKRVVIGASRYRAPAGHHMGVADRLDRLETSASASRSNADKT